MAGRTHRCRRSCPARVPRSIAFCSDCWRRVPGPIKRRIYKSWNRVQESGEALDAYGEHVELLLLVEDALEGDRPWESVEAALAAKGATWT